MEIFVVSGQRKAIQPLGNDAKKFEKFEAPLLQFRKPPTLPFLVSFFKASYYLGVVPFLVSYNERKQQWNLTTSKVHFFFSILFVWIPFLFQDFLYNLHRLIKFGLSETTSAIGYFKVGHAYLSSLRCLLFLWMASWHPAGKITPILESCSTLYSTPPSSRGTGHTLKNKVASVGAVRRMQLYFALLCTTYLILFVIQVVFSPEASTGLMSPVDVFHQRVVLARQRLFLSEPRPSQPYSTLDIVLGSLFMWLSEASLIIHSVSELFLVGPYPLSLWLAVKNFELFWRQAARQWADEKEKPDFGGILEKYKNLKRFSDSLNKMWGVFFLWGVADVSVRSIFLLNDYALSPWMLADCVLYATFFLSADVYVKMNDFREWLTSSEIWALISHSSKKESSFLEIKRVVRELENGPVGIASKGVYKCNYTFIAQVFGYVTMVFTTSFEQK